MHRLLPTNIRIYLRPPEAYHIITIKSYIFITSPLYTLLDGHGLLVGLVFGCLGGLQLQNKCSRNEQQHLSSPYPKCLKGSGGNWQRSYAQCKLTIR